MRKLLIPLVIVLTLIIVACAVADPNDIPVENEKLTIKLDISEEIKEEDIKIKSFSAPCCWIGIKKYI